MEPSPKILVFRIGQLGDTLVGVPALKTLRENFPGSEFDLLYDHHPGSGYVLAEDLLGGTGLIDHFIPYPVGRTGWQKLKAFCAYPALLLHLRRQKYEAVFHLEPGQKTRFRHWRDKLFFRLAGIKVQYSSTPFRKPRPTDRPLPRVESEADFYLRVLREYGLGSRAALPELLRLETGEKEEGEWAEWLNRNPLPPDRIPVGVGIGSKMPAKQWPLDRFQTVLSNLIRENQVFPVFFGGSEDKEAARALVSTLGNGASACGELSLKGSIRGMRDMNYYLGNDTGTMHMAVAAGLRCVAVFSARDVPGKWEPSGEGHIVHRSSVECEGCMLTVCTENKNKCLTGISAREVLASCRALLQPKP